MKISILTLFPEMFQGPFDHSIIKRAISQKLVEIEFISIRDFGVGKHKSVDDTPYGGGVGMILRVDVIEKAVRKAHCKHKCNERVILTDPRGETFSQKKAKDLSFYDHLILISGHYEGIDQRASDYLVDEQISIGDYILTGGEIPIMVIVDSVVRLIPQVLKKAKATQYESFSKLNILEYPHYTKPRSWKKRNVPEVLLSGNHSAIDKWKIEMSKVKKTKKKKE